VRAATDHGPSTPDSTVVTRETHTKTKQKFFYQSVNQSAEEEEKAGSVDCLNE
jgi:hypothetical protein